MSTTSEGGHQGDEAEAAFCRALSRRSQPHPFRYWAIEGGLISYGPDQIDQWRGAATYVDRILRGESPGDLPVRAPTKFELVVNLKTAKALGLSIPPAFPLRADEVIE
jgi:putative tryptophan/tyrosine transport system substrate-binding protein